MFGCILIFSRSKIVGHEREDDGRGEGGRVAGSGDSLQLA